jgi:glycosyltransferase involved in cell wall biosynthesis
MENQVCLCLCVYNNAESLPYVLKNVDKMNPVGVLIFYDKSTDNSLDILKEYQENRTNKNKTCRIIINPQQQSKQKVENIAYARNALLQIIRTEFSHIPYFAMMDANNYSCIGDINMSIFNETILRDDWDAVSFDRTAGYYDYWALSYYPFIYSFFHFSNYEKVLEKHKTDFKKILENYKTNKPNQLITVTSAFNGFAIYKTPLFTNCSYSSDINIQMFPANFLRENENITGEKIMKFKKGDCEHRKFHMEAILRNNARIRICVKSLFEPFDKTTNPGMKHNGPT